MPNKPLPKSLVQRLRKSGKALNRVMGALKSADRRGNMGYTVNAYDTRELGGRVREMNLKRNYPNTELIIKRVHPVRPRYIAGVPALEEKMRKALMQRDGIVELTAKETLEGIRTMISEHNKHYAGKEYHLISPKAYVVHKEILAMAKTRALTLTEIEYTTEGRKVLEGIAKKQGKPVSEVIKEIQKAMSKLYTRTGWTEGNILFLGYKQQKPVFMPIDLI